MQHIILIDKDLSCAKALETACCVLHPQMFKAFTSPLAALEYAQNNTVDFALVNTELHEMSGLMLCSMLRKILPDMIVVFLVAHAEDLPKILQEKADGVLLRPFRQVHIDNILARVALLQIRLKKRVYCHTFGRFDLFIDEKPVVFKSAKAKELLALCVSRLGAPVSIEEIVDKLWEDYNAPPGECSTFRTALKSLTDTLKQYDCGNILIRGRGFCYIDKNSVASDYYDFLNNDKNALCEFQGEFMSDYSWGSSAIYTLSEKKRQYEMEMAKYEE
ncbi:MAG: response regulator [Oscillospiraceae bacterium]